MEREQMKKGLGRGLDSLFGVYAHDDATPVKAEVVKMPGWRLDK